MNAGDHLGNELTRIEWLSAGVARDAPDIDSNESQEWLDNPTVRIERDGLQGAEILIDQLI